MTGIQLGAFWGFIATVNATAWIGIAVYPEPAFSFVVGCVMAAAVVGVPLGALAGWLLSGAGAGA